jgi:hypothetical protein
MSAWTRAGPEFICRTNQHCLGRLKPVTFIHEVASAKDLVVLSPLAANRRVLRGI